MFFEKRFELTAALYDCLSLWLYPYIAESLCLWNYQGGEILHAVFSLLTKNRQSIVLELKIIYIGKGGLISESFSFQIKSPKKGAQNYPEHLIFTNLDSAQEFLAPFGGDLIRNEKLSEIKPPLLWRVWTEIHTLILQLSACRD